MQTALADYIKDTKEGREANEILRKCVHCGLCTATCPTYQLLGDELDGPRGRIYLIKQVLEGNTITARTQLHLDRCLTCRACETTCPSGVRYGRLVDIGRGLVNQQVPRGIRQRVTRLVLRTVLGNPGLVSAAAAVGRAFKPLLPAKLRKKIPDRPKVGPWPPARHSRRMLVLDGCVQPAFAPEINAASARALDRLKISLIRVPGTGCCGALDYHLDAHQQARHAMRANIDAWYDALQAGAEAIVVTASACALMVKEYAEILADDEQYAAKAKRVSEATRDLAEVVAAENLDGLPRRDLRVAFHAPCTLQHGQKLSGIVEDILVRAGYRLTPVPDSHLCCGSAGTYSVLQSKLSEQLLRRKLEALESGEPDVIATANIGCLLHLNTGAKTQAVHWVSLIADD